MVNEGDGLIYSIKKMLKEFNGKIEKNVVDMVNKDILEFGNVKDKGSLEDVEKALEKIKDDALEIGKILYKDPQKKN